MTFVSESIDIDVPVDVLFGLYAEPESLPSVLSIVKHVEVLGPDLIRWDVELVGQRRSIDARVVVNEPGKRLRWESVEGRASFAAEVRTEAITPASTRVTVESFSLFSRRWFSSPCQTVGTAAEKVTPSLSSSS